MIFLSQTGMAVTENAEHITIGPNLSQIVMALGVVILLVLVLAFLSKYIPVMRYNTSQNIKIIEACALGNRDRLMIIEVNTQQLLIGINANSIQTLCVLDEPVRVDRKQNNAFALRFLAAMQGQKNA